MSTNKTNANGSAISVFKSFKLPLTTFVAKYPGATERDRGRHGATARHPPIQDIPPRARASAITLHLMTLPTRGDIRDQPPTQPRHRSTTLLRAAYSR